MLRKWEFFKTLNWIRTLYWKRFYQTIFEICLIRRLPKTLCICFYIKLCEECVHISLQLLLQTFRFLVGFHYLYPFHKISIHHAIVGAGDTLKTWCNLAYDMGEEAILCNGFLINKLLYVSYSLTKSKSIFTSHV